ncbi:pilus assembly protein [Halovibrio salipaludis]|nr:PilC/PilY family type IV pilus protein [Halovibrio salipaludis]
MNGAMCRKIARNWLVGLFLMVPLLASGADLANKPLFVGSKVQPNVMFVIDDSGSMGWSFMPDEIQYDASNGRGDCVRSNWWEEGCQEWEYPESSGERVENQWYYSARVNSVYFDPDRPYNPPLKPDAENSDDRMPDADYTNAWVDGYKDFYNENGGTTKRGLQDDFRHSGTTFQESGAFYYEFDGTVEGCEDNPKQNKCYTYVEMNTQPEPLKQKFANWYSYYRTRMFSARAAIGEGFEQLGDEVRLGWGSINTASNSVDGTNQRTVTQGVRPYGSHRESFYDFLYDEVEPDGGTPLLSALDGAGQYYEQNDRSWAADPASGDSELRECRQSNTILMTDGFWSERYQSGTPQPGNLDGTEGELIENEASGDSYKYEPHGFWSDDTGNTLADVAMNYWRRDIREDLDDFVPDSKKNPAFWQHMVTHGVGLGVEGTFDDQEVLDELASLSGNENRDPVPESELASYDWPDPVNVAQGSPAKIDDLLHASVNTRGQFFSTSDVETFGSQMANLLTEIESEAASSSGVSFDVATLQEEALTFAASFDPASWSGDIQALSIERQDDGDVTFPDRFDQGVWSAAARLDERNLESNGRTIITATGGAGKPFAWDELNSDQQADLQAGVGDDPEELLAFLRGDRSQESTTFRERGSRLGDIVNSTPAYVGDPEAGWPDVPPYAPSESPYSDFAAEKEGRTPVIYAGANDGMLHGFKATENGGEELLAYVPEYLYSDEQGEGLHALADPDYEHRYYVDLSPRTQDVYVDGEWRTVLLGGSRTGANGIFALDVTDPSNFSEANADDIALWEFSDSDDNRMGRITQAPIVSLADWGGQGNNTDVRWTVFLPNGYKSGSDTTGFFMLDLEGGIENGWSDENRQFVEFDSGDGATGLSSMAVLDTDSDGIADRIYAGDLEGNLWAASGQNEWGSVYTSGNGNNATPQPLFSTPSRQGKPQPITAAPRVTRTPVASVDSDDEDFLVLFGTGQYEFNGDASDDQQQSFYAVRDNGSGGLSRNGLVERTVSETTSEGRNIRQSSGNPVDYTNKHGWYLDLPDRFERITTSADTRGDTVFVNSMIPDVNPCAQGGKGWLMAFGLDGQTPEERAFLDFEQPIAGYQVGALPNDSEVLSGGEEDYRVTTLSDGTLDVGGIPPSSADVEGLGRRGWRELLQ